MEICHENKQWQCRVILLADSRSALWTEIKSSYQDLTRRDCFMKFLQNFKLYTLKHKFSLTFCIYSTNCVAYGSRFKSTVLIYSLCRINCFFQFVLCLFHLRKSKINTIEHCPNIWSMEHYQLSSIFMNAPCAENFFQCEFMQHLNSVPETLRFVFFSNI